MASLLFALIALIIPLSSTNMPSANAWEQQLPTVNIQAVNQTDILAGWTDAIPVTNPVSSTVSSAPVAVISTSNLRIVPEVASVNLRVRPDVESYVLGTTQAGEVLQVMEPYASAMDKIGTPGEWLRVQTQDGTEGYTAAWLFAVADSAQVIGGEDTVVVNADALGVYLTPLGDNIRIRETPVTGTILGMVAQGEVVEVVGQDASVADQIGVEGEWVQVRTADGTEGYTAAWLYAVYDGVLPSWVNVPNTVDLPAVANPTDSVVILPLTDGEDPLADSLTAAMPVVVDSLTVDSSVPASIPLLGEAAVQASIPPLADSIGELNLLDATPLQPVAATNSAVVVDEVAAPDEVADTATAATNPAAALLADLLDPAARLTNTVVPITITVGEEIDLARAELAINGHSLATFDDPPFTYDLDTTLLREGAYKLTFTVFTTEGVASIGDLDFEVMTVSQLPTTGGLVAPDAAANLNAVVNPGADATLDTASTLDAAAPDGTALVNAPAATPLNFLLLDGERRDFNLTFTLANGLQPVPVASVATTTAAPESLLDILSSPANLIPAPVKDFLTAQHPVFSIVVVLIMTVILLPQGFFTLYWMTYTWNDPEVAEKYSSPKVYAAPEYSFTAILPARHEEGVIKETIKAVDRIDYPDHLKEILVMIRDEDDDATIRMAQEAIRELGKDNIRLITFTDGPRNKPNGLNRGLRAATNQVICIFDAEDDPHPEIYNVVNTVMLRDDADVVQSGVQLINFESNWFSALNCLEYFFWFKSGLHAFTHQFNVTPLGGNTVFFKKHWLERVGGWDEACLTEDGDIGIRLTQLGAKIQIVYDAKHATQEETPHNVDSFVKQRTRWMQGFYQIFLKGDWRKLPELKQKVTALYILLNSLLQASIVFFIPLGLYIALTQQIPVPLALFSYLPIFLLVIQLVINLVGIREFAEAYNKKLPFLFTLKMLLVYYPFQLLLSASAMRAIWRMLKQNASWEKTAHSNLHRQTEATEATFIREAA